MKIHKMPQRSEEWFEIRKGKLTASNAQAIATAGKGLETYVYQLLAEKYSSERDSYTNPDIERGVELEGSARMTYEIETGNKVDEVGFIEMDEYTGCSPDGLVGDAGGLEIKCVNNVNFFKLLVKGDKAVETKYLWQCHMSMLVSGRTAWDLVFYNQNFEKNLLIFRIVKNIEAQNKLLAGIKKGKDLIIEINKKFNSKR